MNIYSDKCPNCGTFISIPDATKCPGCISSIYWDGRYYHSSAKSRDAQIQAEAARSAAAEASYKAYWNSEEGRKEQREQAVRWEKEGEKRKRDKFIDNVIEGLKSFVGILFVGLVVGFSIGCITYIFQNIIFASSPYPHDQMGQAFRDGFKFGFLLITIPGSLWILINIRNS